MQASPDPQANSSRPGQKPTGAIPGLGPTSGLFVLARLVAGKPVDISGVRAEDPLRPVIEEVANANGRGPREALQEALKDVPGADTIYEQLLAIDIEAGPPPASTSAPPPIPALPNQAEPDPEIAAYAGEWLDEYVRYAQSVSPMTPTLFHESGGLWLAATAIARRLVLPMAFGDIYPNLFVLWLAPTTLFRKSTALGVPRGVARQLFPELLAPQDVTPEAFLSDMAGIEPPKLDTLSDEQRQLWRAERNFAGQRSLVLDEASGWLASTGRDYNAGLLEAFLRFYDCDPSFTRSTRGQGRIAVRDAYLSALVASTPRTMAPHLGAERLWAMGWWPRHALLSPDVDRPDWVRPTASGPPDGRILRPLMTLYAKLPTAVWPETVTPVTVTLEDGVFELWETYNKSLSYDLLTPALDERLYGTYGRLPNLALKVATIMAALTWKGGDAAPRIDLPHLHRAMLITESWRASAHRTLDLSTTAEENIKLGRLVQKIGAAGLEGITVRDLNKAMSNVTRDEMDRLIEQALAANEIEPVQAPTGATGGRPTVRYRVTVE